MKNFYFFITALLIGYGSFGQTEVIAYTSFEEPAIGEQYFDTGDPNVAHDLVNNSSQAAVDYISGGNEIGFDASYATYDTPGTGLTDGDFVGVTDFTGTVTNYTDGTQGYQISDTDGNFILEFDSVDLTNFTNVSVSIDYFIASTGYEGDGASNTSGSDRMRIYVKDLTNNTEIDVLNTEGNDINDLNIEGSWINGNADLVSGTEVQLVIEIRVNAGSEAIFFDNVKFKGESSTASVNKNEIPNFSMYPNPVTNGKIWINTPDNSDKQIEIFDILGKQLLSRNLKGRELNISRLTSGIYILRVTEEGRVATRKLVVK